MRAGCIIGRRDRPSAIAEQESRKKVKMDREDHVEETRDEILLMQKTRFQMEKLHQLYALMDAEDFKEIADAIKEKVEAGFRRADRSPGAMRKSLEFHNVMKTLHLRKLEFELEKDEERLEKQLEKKREALSQGGSRAVGGSKSAFEEEQDVLTEKWIAFEAGDRAAWQGHGIQLTPAVASRGSASARAARAELQAEAVGRMSWETPSTTERSRPPSTTSSRKRRSEAETQDGEAYDVETPWKK